MVDLLFHEALALQDIYARKINKSEFYTCEYCTIKMKGNVLLSNLLLHSVSQNIYISLKSTYYNKIE